MPWPRRRRPATRRSRTCGPAASGSTSRTNAAFNFLKWRPQQTNTKVRLLAEQLAHDFLELDNGERLPTRSMFDKVLMTAHLRAQQREP